MLKISFKKKDNLYLLLFILIFSSCVSRKDIVYFQYDSIDQSMVNNSYETIIKPDDLLQITVSSQNIEAVKPFNLPAVAFSLTTNSAVGSQQQQAYLVDSNGEIDFPILGEIKVGGKSKDSLILLLKNKLSPDYIKDPTINIRIANFKITVLGDVRNPGLFTVPNERITITDAIGLAGDLNISGRRNNILVQREEGDKKVEYRVDLLSKKTLTSPVYYLQQNDIVIVEQNNAKIQSASSNTNTSLFVSITGLLVTIISILTR